MKKSSWIFAVPFIGFLLLCFFFWLALDKDPSHLPSVKIDKPVPQFQLSLLQQPEKVVTEKQLQGEIALLNVWATWCPSCSIEHPYLNKLANEGVTIYGLNYKDERADAQQYLAKKGDPYKFSVFDQEGDLGLDLGVYGAPETYILDANGIVQYRHVGIVDDRSWNDILKPKMEALRNSQ